MGWTAREWITVIDSGIAASLQPGGKLDLRLVMTKFDTPAVTIGYKVRVETR